MASRASDAAAFRDAATALPRSGAADGSPGSAVRYLTHEAGAAREAPAIHPRAAVAHTVPLAAPPKLVRHLTVPMAGRPGPAAREAFAGGTSEPVEVRIEIEADGPARSSLRPGPGIFTRAKRLVERVMPIPVLLTGIFLAGASFTIAMAALRASNDTALADPSGPPPGRESSAPAALSPQTSATGIALVGASASTPTSSSLPAASADARVFAKPAASSTTVPASTSLGGAPRSNAALTPPTAPKKKPGAASEIPFE